MRLPNTCFAAGSFPMVHRKSQYIWAWSISPGFSDFSLVFPILSSLFFPLFYHFSSIPDFHLPAFAVSRFLHLFECTKRMEPWPANPPPQCDGGEKCSFYLQKGLTPEGKPSLLIKIRKVLASCRESWVTPSCCTRLTMQIQQYSISTSQSFINEEFWEKATI